MKLSPKPHRNKTTIPELLRLRLAIRFPGANTVGYPLYHSFACSWGALQKPRAPSLPVKRTRLFFRAGNELGHLITLGVRMMWKPEMRKAAKVWNLVEESIRVGPEKVPVCSTDSKL